MIISKTPLRVSFVGGGTDIREYYKSSFGAVLSSAINKYVYVAVKKQQDFVDFKFRINWSETEFCNSVNEIKHPIVRETLKILKIDFPIEITTFADVPAGTGLGSSSTFTVGLLNALYALLGKKISKRKLAEQSSYIEIEVLKRNIGKQDHYAASYGDINVFKFNKNETVDVCTVDYKSEFTQKLNEKLLMFYTNIKRDASDILKNQVLNTQKKFDTLTKMRNLVNPLLNVFTQKSPIIDFGHILKQGWLLKKEITPLISNSSINNYYEKGISAGAVGGKLLGAGGGGFILFYAEKKNFKNIRKSLSELHELKFDFDYGGSIITYNDE